MCFTMRLSNRETVVNLVSSGEVADTAIASGSNPAGTKLIAPLWHTLTVVLFLLTLSALGARSHSLAPVASAHGHTRGYLTVIGIEWLLVGFVWWGVRLRKVRMRDLIGGDGITFLHVIRDLGIAILFLISSNIVLATMAYLLKATRNQAVRSLVPSGRQEVVMYLLLSLTAGICEEIVCRGYLQKQFAALTKNIWAGIAIQGIIFGAAHGYQGSKMMLVIAVYGCLFGLLVLWRKSLQPGMMVHALQDGLVGVLARTAPR